MTQEDLKVLLSLSELPFIEGCKWVKRKGLTDKLDIVRKARFEWRIFFADQSRDSDVLALLAKDKAWMVRGAVANNPSTPLASLAELAQDLDDYVRALAANNPSTPSASLAELAQDPDPDVRAAAAGNGSTPPASLAKLAHDPDPDVCIAAARNRSTPFAGFRSSRNTHYIRTREQFKYAHKNMHIELAKGKAPWSPSWWPYAVVGINKKRCLEKIAASGWERISSNILRGCEIVPASDTQEDIKLADELRLMLRREKANEKARFERMSSEPRPAIPQPQKMKS